ncbi:MAG: hypothetical protein HY823_02630 [Acidobacteria bacterium]|nr:hypothetical protein [Acidobacteriota bacterium]
MLSLLLAAAALSPQAASPPPAASAPALPVSLSDRLREGRNGWEQAIQRGDGSFVRRSIETLLDREGTGVNSSDYNEMHAMVALRNLAAQACVVEGAWEDGVGHLQKAAAGAAENASNAEQTLARLRRQHQDKLAEWKEGVAKQEQRLKDLEAQPGLTEAQMRTRNQVRAYLEEHRNAMAHSERALRSMDDILVQLRLDQETYGKSLAEWHGFLAKEKLEIAQAQGQAAYVTGKLAQVKADDARPRFERLAYGRRLLRLDPGNADAKRFVNGLLGIEDETEKPKPPKRKSQPKK